MKKYLEFSEKSLSFDDAIVQSATQILELK
jgi:hypothetical protein